MSCCTDLWYDWICWSTSITLKTNLSKKNWGFLAGTQKLRLQCPVGAISHWSYTLHCEWLPSPPWCRNPHPMVGNTVWISTPAFTQMADPGIVRCSSVLLWGCVSVNQFCVDLIPAEGFRGQLSTTPMGHIPQIPGSAWPPQSLVAPKDWQEPLGHVS